MDKLWEMYVSSAMRVGAPVTVGIGVVCDAEHAGGPCVIISADDKGTYGQPPVTTNNVCGKIHGLQPICNLAVAISGNVSTCDVVVGELAEQLKEAEIHEREVNKRDLQIDNVRIALRKARAHEYEYYAREQMQSLLSMSLEQWQEETNAEKRRKGWAVMRYAQRYFPVWLIVGGFLGNNHLLQMSSGGGEISGGDDHYAVGIGNAAAYKTLHKRNHRIYDPAPMALVHVAEAMESARRAARKYIGRPHDYCVFRRGKPMMRFRRDSPVLAEWIKQGTKSMKDSVELRKLFESELYEDTSFRNP